MSGNPGWLQQEAQSNRGHSTQSSRLGDDEPQGLTSHVVNSLEPNTSETMPHLIEIKSSLKDEESVSVFNSKCKTQNGGSPINDHNVNSEYLNSAKVDNVPGEVTSLVVLKNESKKGSVESETNTKTSDARMSDIDSPANKNDNDNDHDNDQLFSTTDRSEDYSLLAGSEDVDIGSEAGGAGFETPSIPRGSGERSDDESSSPSLDSINEAARIKMEQDKLAVEYRELSRLFSEAKFDRASKMLQALKKGKRFGLFNKIYQKQYEMLEQKRKDAQKMLDYKTLMIRKVTFGEVRNIWTNFFNTKNRIKMASIRHVQQQLSRLDHEYQRARYGDSSVSELIELNFSVVASLRGRPQLTSLDDNEIESDLNLIRRGHYLELQLDDEDLRDPEPITNEESANILLDEEYSKNTDLNDQETAVKALLPPPLPQQELLQSTPLPSKVDDTSYSNAVAHSQQPSSSVQSIPITVTVTPSKKRQASSSGTGPSRTKFRVSKSQPKEESKNIYSNEISQSGYLQPPQHNLIQGAPMIHFGKSGSEMIPPPPPHTQLQQPQNIPHHDQQQFQMLRLGSYPQQYSENQMLPSISQASVINDPGYDSRSHLPQIQNIQSNSMGQPYYYGYREEHHHQPQEQKQDPQNQQDQKSQIQQEQTQQQDQKHHQQLPHQQPQHQHIRTGPQTAVLDQQMRNYNYPYSNDFPANPQNYATLPPPPPPPSQTVHYTSRPYLPDSGQQTYNAYHQPQPQHQQHQQGQQYPGFQSPLQSGQIQPMSLQPTQLQSGQQIPVMQQYQLQQALPLPQSEAHQPPQPLYSSGSQNSGYNYQYPLLRQ